ncbi:MAG: GNAT family N-acetyltransferase, partial [Holophagales bacterium]|nr:GNAT family N-acetyltransferase [Holophagales bacterium]
AAAFDHLLARDDTHGLVARLGGRPVAFTAHRLWGPEEAYDGGGAEIGKDTAAITLAVDPSLRRLGLATLLLERTMVSAARLGIERLVGLAHRESHALTELFRRGGFETETSRDGDVLRFVFAATATPDSGPEADRDSLRDRIHATASLHPLFHPRSVAVVGASRNVESVGYRILTALVRGGFRGPVYPINPKASHVGSIAAYPSLEALCSPAGAGRAVDLAVIAVPAPAVMGVIRDCGRFGVRALVVITAGFAEVGSEGAAAQEELRLAVREHGLRMVGPNCLGVMHTHPEVCLNASFAPIMPELGTVALGSQSGALGIAIIALARRLGLGLSSFVSMGNKADISGNDLLEYWEEDPTTRVVLFYLESFGNPRRFAQIARRVGRSKPIVVVKSGRSQAGKRAASSHTAALTAADTAVEALFRQTGITRADTLAEMFAIARALTTQPLPPGRRVAIVTNAGGPGILCADALEASGLTVEPLSEAVQAELRAFLPDAASASNPVDMIATAGPETYRRAVSTVLRAEEVDTLVVIHTPTGIQGPGEIEQAVAEAVAEARAHTPAAPGELGGTKPIFASVVGDEEETFGLPCPHGETVPVYAFPEELGRVLGKIADYADWRRAGPGLYPEPADQDLARAREICHRALDLRGEGWLTVPEALDVLRAAGLTVADGGFAASAEAAVALAEEVGFPVAMKLASTTLVHKTEHGGVALDLEDAEQLRLAFEELAGRLEASGHGSAMDGVWVQPMLEGSCEVMVGVDLDPVFGPLVAFGLGGIHVEILRDVAFRVTPLSERDAREMIRSVRGYRLFEGYRGHAAADVPALQDALIRISRLAEAVPEIVSLDLNPLFALPPGEGYRIADVRIRVA